MFRFLPNPVNLCSCQPPAQSSLSRSRPLCRWLNSFHRTAHSAFQKSSTPLPSHNRNQPSVSARFRIGVGSRWIDAHSCSAQTWRLSMSVMFLELTRCRATHKLDGWEVSTSLQELTTSVTSDRPRLRAPKLQPPPTATDKISGSQDRRTLECDQLRADFYGHGHVACVPEHLIHSLWFFVSSSQQYKGGNSCTDCGRCEIEPRSRRRR